MLKEFREFALKGNVVDLAIGVIIGAAFSRIVESIVGDVFMPLIAAITRGGVDFSNYFLPLSGDVTATSSMQLVRRAQCSPTAASSRRPLTSSSSRGCCFSWSRPSTN